jgi:hypothetical protein
MFAHKYKRNGLTLVIIVLAVFVVGLISFSAVFSWGATNFPNSPSTKEIKKISSFDPSQLSLPSTVVTHLPTPKPLRAVYMSSWVAGSKEARAKLLKRLEGTSINTIVIDVKDSSGKIVVKLEAPALAKYNSLDSHVPDIVEFVNELHQRGYYVIGHISVFEDNYLTRQRPDLAIMRSDNGLLWQDNKGMSWLDPSSPEVWDYAVAVAREAYSVGFDELNFDYIRFPSDGEISKMRFPNYDASKKNKSKTIEEFFSYLHNQMQDIGAPTSANLFGLATVNTEDFGIGQVLEKATPYFDYICPMVYPSHYPANWRGIKKPATAPYQVIKISLDSAVKRLNAQGLPAEKIRPWLQDFNLGATYTASMIKAEIKAVNDTGLDSWMMWDPTNQYTISAYRKTGAN